MGKHDDIGTLGIKEDININMYQKTEKCCSKYGAVVKEKYPNAIAIYPLIRRKKLNILEEIIDFIVQPGVLQVADSFHDLSTYYLIKVNLNL